MLCTYEAIGTIALHCSAKGVFGGNGHVGDRRRRLGGRPATGIRRLAGKKWCGGPVRRRNRETPTGKPWASSLQPKPNASFRYPRSHVPSQHAPTAPAGVDVKGRGPVARSPCSPRPWPWPSSSSPTRPVSLGGLRFPAEAGTTNWDRPHLETEEAAEWHRPPAGLAYTVHPARPGGSRSRALASSSPANRSAAGSQANFLPTWQAM